jgi:hypothetical protein
MCWSCGISDRSKVWSECRWKDWKEKAVVVIFHEKFSKTLTEGREYATVFVNVKCKKFFYSLRKAALFVE